MRLTNLFTQALVAAFVLVASTGWGKVTVSKSRDVTTVQFDIEEVSFSVKNLGGKNFSKATLVGVSGYEGIEYEVGAPEIPVIRMLVTGEVRVTSGDAVLQHKRSPFEIIPSQASWSKSLKVPPPISFNKDLYKTNKFIGSTSYSIEDAGSVRGLKQHLVTLRPFLYNPGTGQYQLRTRYIVRKVEPKSENKNAPTIAFVIGAKFADSEKVAELEDSKNLQGYRVHRIVIGQNGVTDDISLKLQSRTI